MIKPKSNVLHLRLNRVNESLGECHFVSVGQEWMWNVRIRRLARRKNFKPDSQKQISDVNFILGSHLVNPFDRSERRVAD